MAADLDIGGLIGPDRHIISREIGSGRERTVQGSLGGLEGLFFLRYAVLDARDFRLELIGPGLVALTHRLADLLRSGIAAFLQGLEPRNEATARVIESEELLRLLRQSALGEAFIESLRIVADGFDVVHVRFLWCRDAIKPRARKAKPDDNVNLRKVRLRRIWQLLRPQPSPPPRRGASRGIAQPARKFHIGPSAVSPWRSAKSDRAASGQRQR